MLKEVFDELLTKVVSAAQAVYGDRLVLLVLYGSGETMPLHIIDPKAETLASELARKTGESVPEAVVHAFEARLETLREKEAAIITLDAIMRIAERCKNLPDLDQRSPDEMLGYDKVGLFQ